MTKNYGPILTKENISFVFDELKKKIENNAGVNVCIQQKSKNFENWVQVELCNILSRIVGDDKISVESKNIDIVVGEKSEGSKVKDIKLAIEIKILKIGPEGYYNKSGCEKDIKEKLSNIDFAQDVEKALLCVVYNVPGKRARTKTWSQCREHLLVGNREVIPPQAIDFKYKQTTGYLDLIVVA